MLINQRLGIAWRMTGWLAVYRQVNWLQSRLPVQPRADRPPPVPMHLPAERCTHAPPCYPLAGQGRRCPSASVRWWRGAGEFGERQARRFEDVQIWTPCASHPSRTRCAEACAAAVPGTAVPICTVPPPYPSKAPSRAHRPRLAPWTHRKRCEACRPLLQIVSTFCTKTGTA